jgi:hypothetical protein
LACGYGWEQQVSKKEELKLAETDEDKHFRDHVRTAKQYNLLIRAQAEQLPLAHIQRTFENMLVRLSSPSQRSFITRRLQENPNLLGESSDTAYCPTWKSTHPC